MSSNKFIAVQVPWMIDASHGTRVAADEEEAVAVAVFAAGEYRESQFHRSLIGAIFSTCVATKFSPSIELLRDLSREEIFVTTAAYDEDLVERLSDRNAFEREWKSSGLCPSPMMYKVENSKWIAALEIDPHDLTHYVLFSHGGIFEVVCEGWTWEEIESEDEFMRVALSGGSA